MIAARETCHRLGVPHVTLDLREEFRRAVVAPFVRGYARGETPNPCTRCNGGFRFAELLAFARRAGAERLATGHYARIVERDGRLLLARGADPAKDQSYMLAAARSAQARARLVPARRAGQGGDAGRGRARRARRRAPAREPGGVLPRRRRLPRVPRPARARAATDGAIVDEDGTRARPSRRLLAVHAGPAPRSRARRARAALRPRHAARRRTPSSSARARRSRAPRSARAAASTPTPSGSRRSSATARRRCRPASSRPRAASGSSSTSRRTASRRARRRCSTTATPSSDMG